MALPINCLVDFVEAYVRHNPDGPGFAVIDTTFFPNSPEVVYLTLMRDTGRKEVVPLNVEKMQVGAEAIMDYIKEQLAKACKAEEPVPS